MSEPIRIGIVGLGRAGMGMHGKELMGKEDKFKIVAVCDPIASRLETMEQRYGCRTYTQVEDLVQDPEVELVDIASRSIDHYTHGLLALASDKHVFMEKPLSNSFHEAVLLQKMAAQSKGNLYVRHNRRFDPDFLHVKEIIESGILGDVYEIKLRRHQFQRRDDWQTIKEFGGGQLLNWGPHIIDHALQFLDGPVASLWSDLKRVAAVGDSEDHVKIVMKGLNGCVVDLEISGGVTLPSPVYTVYGTRGSLKLTETNEILLKYLDTDVELAHKKADPGTPGETFGSIETLVWKEETMPVRDAGVPDIWDELHAAIRENKPFPIKLEEAVEVMRIISKVKENTEF